MKALELTANERFLLESYKSTLIGLADYLGPCYEIVLHSLEDLDHSVILILNEHTGRNIGSPITDFALSMLNKIQTTSEEQYISYFATNRNGEPLKSSTIAIRGENNRVISLLCINFYMNTPLNTFMDTFTPKDLTVATKINNENFVSSSLELILESIRRIQNEVNLAANILMVNKNKEIIARLDNEGIFKLKNSVNTVSKSLCISKNTVYLHLRNLQKPDNSK